MNYKVWLANFPGEAIIESAIKSFGISATAISMNLIDAVLCILTHPSPPSLCSYLVTHINDMQALVIVDHEGGFFNLYLSDESGVYYSLSLRDLVIDRYGIDLELVRLSVRDLW